MTASQGVHPQHHQPILVGPSHTVLPTQVRLGARKPRLGRSRLYTVLTEERPIRPEAHAVSARSEQLIDERSFASCSRLRMGTHSPGACRRLFKSSSQHRVEGSVISQGADLVPHILLRPERAGGLSRTTSNFIVGSLGGLSHGRSLQGNA